VEEAAHPVLRTLLRAAPGFHRDIAVVNAGLHYGVGDPGYRCAHRGASQQSSEYILVECLGIFRVPV
jgi:hypothetical protein